MAGVIQADGHEHREVWALVTVRHGDWEIEGIYATERAAWDAMYALALLAWDEMYALGLLEVDETSDGAAVSSMQDTAAPDHLRYECAQYLWAAAQGGEIGVWKHEVQR